MNTATTPENGKTPSSGGRFAQNVAQFARALRSAGLPVGPGRVLEALRAVEVAGVASREDLYWTLHAVFVSRRDQRELFDQCFHIFWRDPKLLERLMNLMLPQLQKDQEQQGEDVNRRVAEALAPEKQPGQGEAPEVEDEPEDELELDMVLTYSANEVLQQKDFEEMSADELADAKRRIKGLRLPIMERPTRRFALHPRGRRIDLRKTLRQSLRGGGAIIDIARRKRLRRPPPLVILCDISGSMSRYSRMLLLFMHTIASDRERVHSFVFGTRLTNITRYLRNRDVDVALEKVGEVVKDWSGGTRIGHCLEDFNKHWSRRVLGQGAVVMIITDGLDRDAGEGLEVEMQRLHKSCRRLVWLNPLLRYEGFEPISTGARAMVRHVDDFRTVHNLDSLGQLADVLSHEPHRRAEGVSAWTATREEMAHAG
jgi:uncharacterized protein with von Willebrand factor type A (vWA) domain